MKKILIFTIAALTLSLMSSTSFARPNPGAGGGKGKDKGKPTPEQRAKILEEFDKDGDGKLSKEERAAAKKAMAPR